MVLRQHGVSWVGGVVVVKDNKLLLLAACNELVRPGLHLVSDLPDDGENQGSNDRKDEDGHLVPELLLDLWQHGDLFHRIVNLLYDVIVPLYNWHDLTEDVLDVKREFLRLPRGHFHVLGLGRNCVGLELLDLLALVLSAENTIGNLVKKVPEETGIGLRGFLERSLQLLDLILGEFVRDWGVLESMHNTMR